MCGSSRRLDGQRRQGRRRRARPDRVRPVLRLPNEAGADLGPAGLRVRGSGAASSGGGGSIPGIPASVAMTDAERNMLGLHPAAREPRPEHPELRGHPPGPRSDDGPGRHRARLFPDPEFELAAARARSRDQDAERDVLHSGGADARRAGPAPSERRPAEGLGPPSIRPSVQPSAGAIGRRWVPA